MPDPDTTVTAPIMSLKVSIPGKFCHLPLNKMESHNLQHEDPKAGSVAAIQKLLNKV